MDLPSKKQIAKERAYIDSFSFTDLYNLYMNWPAEIGLSKTAHYHYVKQCVVEDIRNMPTEEYKSFLNIQ